MNAKLFRCLVLFCCTTAAGLVAFGTYRYWAQRNWIEQINSPENVVIAGAVEFQSPESTSNAMYVAGLFLALGGCFWLKASRHDALEERGQVSETFGDEN